jgi:hypothetical protein
MDEYLMWRGIARFEKADEWHHLLLGRYLRKRELKAFTLHKGRARDL